MDPVFEMLMSVLPVEWAVRVEGILAAVALLAGVLVPLKAAIAKWVPARWRFWLDGLFELLDWLALNSKPLSHRPTKEQRKAKP
jgi:hypothetical protein